MKEEIRRRNCEELRTECGSLKRQSGERVRLDAAVKFMMGGDIHDG